MVEIYNLMNKAEANLKKTELKKLEAMSAEAETYEVLGLRPKKAQTII